MSHARIVVFSVILCSVATLPPVVRKPQKDKFVSDDKEDNGQGDHRAPLEIKNSHLDTKSEIDVQPSGVDTDALDRGRNPDMMVDSMAAAPSAVVEKGRIREGHLEGHNPTSGTQAQLNATSPGSAGRKALVNAVASVVHNSGGGGGLSKVSITPNVEKKGDTHHITVGVETGSKQSGNAYMLRCDADRYGQQPKLHNRKNYKDEWKPHEKAVELECQLQLQNRGSGSPMNYKLPFLAQMLFLSMPASARDHPLPKGGTDIKGNNASVKDFHTMKTMWANDFIDANSLKATYDSKMVCKEVNEFLTGTYYAEQVLVPENCPTGTDTCRPTGAHLRRVLSHYGMLEKMDFMEVAVDLDADGTLSPEEYIVLKYFMARHEVGTVSAIAEVDLIDVAMYTAHVKLHEDDLKFCKLNFIEYSAAYEFLKLTDVLITDQKTESGDYNDINGMHVGRKSPKMSYDVYKRTYCKDPRFESLGYSRVSCIERTLWFALASAPVHDDEGPPDKSIPLIPFIILRTFLVVNVRFANAATLFRLPYTSAIRVVSVEEPQFANYFVNVYTHTARYSTDQDEIEDRSVSLLKQSQFVFNALDVDRDGAVGITEVVTWWHYISCDHHDHSHTGVPYEGYVYGHTTDEMGPIPMIAMRLFRANALSTYASKWHIYTWAKSEPENEEADKDGQKNHAKKVASTREVWEIDLEKMDMECQDFDEKLSLQKDRHSRRNFLDDAYTLLAEIEKVQFVDFYTTYVLSRGPAPLPLSRAPVNSLPISPIGIMLHRGVWRPTRQVHLSDFMAVVSYIGMATATDDYRGFTRDEYHHTWH
jgi:hypothetical protein